MLPSLLIGAALMALALWTLGILPAWIFLKFGKFLEWISPLVAAIATAYIAYFTLTLKKATDKLWGASERQLTQFEGTAKKELRTYLSVAPGGINPYRGPTDRILGHVGIINNGHTPARDIQHFVHLSWCDKDNWKPPTIDKVVKTDIVLQPRAEMKIGSEPEELSIIGGREENRSYLYVWGRIEYLDEFSNHIHFTNFCHRYNSAGDVVFRDRTIPEGDGRYHEDGNGADYVLINAQAM
jgi:hypothetical protein